jgi:fatty acid desaturase
MHFEILIPITLFICAYLAIKVVVDARARKHMVQSNGSEDMLRTIIEGEETRRRQTSLRWGVILVALAIGFGLIEAAGWDRPTPGVFAILLAATGIGNLAAYFLANKVK